MNNDTLKFLEARWNYNKLVIKQKLVGYGDAKIENDLINMIVISEKIEDKYDFTIKTLTDNSSKSSMEKKE